MILLETKIYDIRGVVRPPPGEFLLGLFSMEIRAGPLYIGDTLSDEKSPHDPSHLHHYIDTATGLVHTMNIHTGEIVAIQREARELAFVNGSYGGLEEVEQPNGEIVWVERGLADRVPRKIVRYNPTLAGAICAMVADGVPLTDIAKRADMPNYSVLARWRRLYPEFAKNLDEARVDRTERFHDEALAIADEAYRIGDDKMVGLAKLRVDVRKWAAEKGDPDRYATKTKVQAEGVLTVMIHTGILRPGDSGYIEQLKEVAPAGGIVETIEDSQGDDSGTNKVQAITADTAINNSSYPSSGVGEF